MYLVEHTPIPWESVTDFSVDIETCYEVIPCDHPTTYTFISPIDGKVKTVTDHYVNGRQIKYLYEHFGLEVPSHFIDYDAQNAGPLSEVQKTQISLEEHYTKLAQNRSNIAYLED